MIEDPKYPRRTLLVLGGAAATQLAAGCAILRGGASHPTYAPTESAISAGVAKIPLSELGKLEKGQSLLVKLPADAPEILIATLEDGTYLASSADCTHMSCTVAFEARAKEWVCDCHGSRFALDGKVLEGPADEPLPQAQVRVEGDQLIVDYSKLI